MYRIVIISFLLILTNCTTGNISGTNDETSTGIAKVFMPDGKTPASNAFITIFAVNDTTQLYQTETNSTGEYRLTDLVLPLGILNVQASLNDSLNSIQKFYHLKKGTIDLKDDTLQYPGSLTGYVKLQPNHPKWSVTVKVLGTNVYSNTDSSGQFRIKKIAGGEYTINISTSIDGYTERYEEIIIQAGVDDTLTDTLELKYNNVPVVTGVKAEYDSTQKVVKLSWDKSSYPYSEEYLFYRKSDLNINWPFEPIASVMHPDTSYHDSLSNIPDSLQIKSFRYRVTLRSKTNEEGLPFGFVEVNMDQNQ